MIRGLKFTLLDRILYAEALVSLCSFIPTGRGVDAQGEYRLLGVPFTVIHWYGNSDATLRQTISHPPIANILLNHLCYFAILGIAWLAYRRFRQQAE